MSAVYFYPTLASTNDQAKILARQPYGAADGTLVITPRQTAGRGRAGNRWWAGRGILTFSIIFQGAHVNTNLKSAAAGDHHPAMIALVAGLSVVRSIRSIQRNFPVGVKWPNDIYSHGRKMGGILVESQTRRDEASFYIVGIGLNVNATFRESPADLKKTATSLRLISNRPWDEPVVLEKILSQLLRSAKIFNQNGFDPFMDDWARHDVVPIGSRIAVEEADRILEGQYGGLIPGGAIRLRQSSGIDHKIYSGTLMPTEFSK